MIRKAIQDPARALRGLRNRGIGWYVKARNGVTSGPRPAVSASGFPLFDDVRRFALTRTDISDHLPRLFVEALRYEPKLIVELGVRGGASTFALERVARLTGAELVSVDIDECSSSSTYPDWHFVQADDIEFAGRFAAWCRERGIAPEIDVLFIDTSHLYEHTVDEIAHWFPHLAERAVVFFHDTNMRDVFTRNDGSVGQGWDNDRAVIRAVEEFFGRSFDETVDFVHMEPGWLIRHHAGCNGFTILEKGLGVAAPSEAGAEAALATSSR